MTISLNILATGEKAHYASNFLLLLTFGIFEDNGTEVACPLKSDFPVWIWIPNQGRKTRSNYSWDFQAAPGYTSPLAFIPYTQMKRTEHETEKALSEQRGILQAFGEIKVHKHYNSVNNALYLKGSGYIYHLASYSLPSRGVSEYKTLTWFDGPVLSSQSAPALQLDILSNCFKWSQRIKT